MSSGGGGTHHPIPEFRDADHFWGPGLSQVVNGSHEIIRPKPRRWVLSSSSFLATLEKHGLLVVSFPLVGCVRKENFWICLRRRYFPLSRLAHLIIHLDVCLCVLNKRKLAVKKMIFLRVSLGLSGLCVFMIGPEDGLSKCFFFLFFLFVFSSSFVDEGQKF